MPLRYKTANLNVVSMQLFYTSCDTTIMCVQLHESNDSRETVLWLVHSTPVVNYISFAHIHHVRTSKTVYNLISLQTVMDDNVMWCW